MADYIPRESKHDPNLQTVTHPSMHPIHGPTSVGLGGTMVLLWNCGTSFSRRGHGTTVEPRYFFFTVPVPSRSQYTVVPQYHKYHSTTARYLPINSHFSEDFHAKSQFIDWVNKLEVFKLNILLFGATGV